MTTLLLPFPHTEIDYTGRNSRLAIESVAVGHVKVSHP